MLKDDFFFITHFSQKESNILLFEIKLNKDHEIFDGHFPDFPIVPGVFTLQMIKELTEYHLNISLNVISINKLKFLTPINPNEHINLQVEINYTFSESEVYINTASIFSGQITFFKLNKAVYKY